MPPIQIQRTDAPGSTTLRVSGELDLTTAGDLEREILTAQQPGTDLTLDLTDIAFIDSSGLQLILDADFRAREQGGKLGVVAGTGEVARVLELAQVVDRLHVTTLE